MNIGRVERLGKSGSQLIFDADLAASVVDADLIRNDSGKPKPILANAIAALSTEPQWAGVLAYNAFSLYVVTRKPAPWQKTGGSNWTDCDDTRTADWLQHHGIFVNSRIAGEAVQVVGHANTFHPVREYLDGIIWDGKPRVENWLTSYLGVESTSFSQAIGARYLISAIARISDPGCRVDHTLILEGPQGIQKSTALRTLAGSDWFADSLSDLSTKDAKLELHGVWIFELGELAAVKRSQIEKVKVFLTSPFDHFRPPYGRRAEHIPRTNVFAGTVNDSSYLTDETGNRRFWPVRCGRINVDALALDRNQLWAEAKELYVAGHPWWLNTAPLEALATSEQEIRYEPGVWDQRILDWLESPTPNQFDAFFSSSARVSVSDILVHCLGKPLKDCRQGDRLQVVRCLTHAKWTRTREPSGRRAWFYERP